MGKPQKEIAFDLGLTYDTVKVYYADIHARMRTHNHTDCAVQYLLALLEQARIDGKLDEFFTFADALRRP